MRRTCRDPYHPVSAAVLVVLFCTRCQRPLLPRPHWVSNVRSLPYRFRHVAWHRQPERERRPPDPPRRRSAPGVVSIIGEQGIRNASAVMLRLSHHVSNSRRQCELARSTMFSRSDEKSFMTCRLGSEYRWLMMHAPIFYCSQRRLENPRSTSSFTCPEILKLVRTCQPPGDA